MASNRRIASVAGVAAGAIALVMTSAAVYPATSRAADASVQVAAAASATATATPTAPTSPLPGRGDPRGPMVNADEYLAAALGITEDELTSAKKEAATAALAQAVENGDLTQTQADEIAARWDDGGPAGFRIPGLRDSDIDYDSLLAEALGITTDQLSAAQEQAYSDALDAAVEDGTMTQDEADLAQARHDLEGYLRTKTDATMEEALAAAVADGIVTQEQLDEIQSQMKPARGGPDGQPGQWGKPGEGGPQGNGDVPGGFGEGGPQGGHDGPQSGHDGPGGFDGRGPGESGGQ